MSFPPLAARLGLAALALAALIAALAIGVVRLGLAGFGVGLEIMTASAAFGLIALMLALIWLTWALQHNRGDGRRAGLGALIGSLLLLYTPLHTLYQGLMAPPIHDVTTDPDNAPTFVALAKRPPGANSADFNANAMIDYRGEHGTVSYILHEYYVTGAGGNAQPLTKPLALLMPTDKMFWRCFNTVKKMGWQLVAFDPKEGRIEARATSFWFGQVSDIVIRVRQAGPLGARFDMRAESESGNRDFGHNLDLLKAYRLELSS